MIAGHFGLAAGVKAKEPAVPLWALMLATAWLDVVFVPLFLAGIETIEPAPDATGPYGASIIHANYTHSLFGAVVLSLIFGFAARRFWGDRAGWVLGLVAFSHWILDLIVHRGDLPILIGNVGNLPTLGFGLWRYPTVSAAVELVLVLAGSWLYWRAARQTAEAAGGEKRGLADLAGGLMLVFGLGTLAADLTGFLA
ncbi:MAG TPA: hypothetical protein VG894_10740 [Bauldia sp.]|nr:hypothetical protein [Bauldia sp.]